jgi:hypothetical protein
VDRKPGAQKPLCPSARGKPGAMIVGLLGSDRRIAFINPPLRVDPAFLNKAGPNPERRFRFADNCVETSCLFWSNNKCSVASYFSRATEGGPVSTPPGLLNTLLLPLVLSGGCSGVYDLSLYRNGRPGPP